MFGKKLLDVSVFWFMFDDVSNSPETRLLIGAHAAVDMLPSPRRRTTDLNAHLDPPPPTWDRRRNIAFCLVWRNRKQMFVSI